MEKMFLEGKNLNNVFEKNINNEGVFLNDENISLERREFFKKIAIL
jgi:hypothetical protein